MHENGTPPIGTAHGSNLLITWVWSLEIFGAITGLANAGYTTFGDTLPTTLGEYLQAIPMLMLPVAELGRVPLTSAIFSKKPMACCLAFIVVVVLTYPTIENWTIGFDRIAQMRVRVAVSAENRVAQAKADLAAADRGYDETIKQSEAKRVELRASIATRDQNIVAMGPQLKSANDAHQSNLVQIRAACVVVREQCILPRSQVEDKRYDAEVSELRSALTVAQKERQEFQLEFDNLVKSDDAAAAKLAVEQRRLAKTVSDTEGQLREARNDNFLYRLAASHFGTRVDDLTAPQIAAARWVFAVACAVVVAMAGTLGAIIHYSPNRSPGAPSFIGAQVGKLTRARRAYLARRRKSIPVSDKGMADFLQLARAVAEGAKPKTTESVESAAATHAQAATAPLSNADNRKMPWIIRPAT